MISSRACQQALRRPPCGQRLLASGRARLDHRADRPERRRQVDAVQPRRRHHAAGQRPGRARRRGCHRLAGAPAVPSRHARTFQIAHEFSNMTALENLMMVPPGQPGESLFRRLVRAGARWWARSRALRRRARDVLAQLRLDAPRARICRQSLRRPEEAARARPHHDGRCQGGAARRGGAGVNRTLLQDLAANIERMNRELGYTFFVIEHDMDLIGRLCDPVIVMAQGEEIAAGPMAEIRANPAIIEAYFGAARGARRSAHEPARDRGTSSAAMAARRHPQRRQHLPSSRPTSASSSGRTAPASRRR